MTELGSRTRQLLEEFGIDEVGLAAIVSGEVSWEVFDPSYPEQDYGGNLVLLHAEGGQRFIRGLSSTEVKQLLNAWEFERRESVRERPRTFPLGDLDDWTGIRPDSDWYDVVRGYREAVDTLSKTVRHVAAAPYLYLCRHLLELQLKAIIMLGQQSMKLEPDLPCHHDLQRLWTAAFPIAKLFPPYKGPGLECVRQLVDDYHEVDPQAMNFRYPVSRNNRPIEHESFVHAFSHQGHATQLQSACDVLDSVIMQLRISAMFTRLPATAGELQADDQ